MPPKNAIEGRHFTLLQSSTCFNRCHRLNFWLLQRQINYNVLNPEVKLESD